MKKYLIIPFALSLAACSFEAFVPKSSAPEVSPKYESGQVIVRGDYGDLKLFISENFDASEAKLSTVDASYEIHKVEILDPSGKSVEDLVEDLEAEEFVDFAEPNYLVSAHNLDRSKDPFWLKQWALSNVGQDAPSGLPGEVGADISAPAAWEINKGSREIIVGVIDTGIDYKHPDLKSNMWVNEKEKAGMLGVDDDGNGYVDDVYGWNFISGKHKETYHGQVGRPDPMDDNSHGTHCAGIIGATPNNAEGIAGVNWQVRLMALKFLDKNGSGSTEDAFKAILYGADNGAHVLSNSWGGGGASRLLKFAIEKALEKGVLFVAAAGNSSSNNDISENYPSNYDVANVMAVAATDNKDRLAQFSSYGVEKVHIAAPGVSIMSTIPIKGLEDGQSPYAAYSGTSMATPYVAGAAALVLAHDSSLRGKAVELKARLMATSDRATYLNGFVTSGGRLNLERALTNDRNLVDTNPVTVKEAYSIESPRYPSKEVDNTWVVKKDGAKRIRVIFSWVLADVPRFDLLAIYDGGNNLVYKFEDKYPGGFTTPWVEGDSIKIRFANAIVAMNEEVKKKFNSPDDGFRAGANSCKKAASGNFECVLIERSKPFANFESEGFAVESIEYVK